jgi:HEAT repeat protein
MRPFILVGAVLALLGSRAEAGGTKTAPKREDMPKYINMLKNAQNPKDRALAADQIGRRGAIQLNDVREAVPLLQKATTKDNDANVRRACAEALGRLATDAENSVPPLMEALKDKNMPVSLAAVSALGNFGVEARDAVPALREFSKKQKDKKINKMVAETIGKITGKKKKD